MDRFRPDKSVSDVLACAVRRHNPPKKLCPGSESNQPHVDFQSTALPTELPGHRCSGIACVSPAFPSSGAYLASGAPRCNTYSQRARGAGRPGELRDASVRGIVLSVMLARSGKPDQLRGGKPLLLGRLPPPAPQEGRCRRRKRRAPQSWPAAGRPARTPVHPGA